MLSHVLLQIILKVIYVCIFLCYDYNLYVSHMQCQLLNSFHSHFSYASQNFLRDYAHEVRENQWKEVRSGAQETQP